MARALIAPEHRAFFLVERLAEERKQAFGQNVWLDAYEYWSLASAGARSL